MKSLIALSLLITSLARADGFYFETGVSVLDKAKALPPLIVLVAQPALTRYGEIRYNAVPVAINRHYTYDITNTRNPYANVVLGYEKDFRCFSLNCTTGINVAHQSSVSTGQDYGRNSANASLRIWLGGR